MRKKRKKTEELANKKAQKEAEQARKVSELGIDALVSQVEAIASSAGKQTEQLKEQEKRFWKRTSAKKFPKNSITTRQKRLQKFAKILQTKNSKKRRKRQNKPKRKRDQNWELTR